MKKINPYVLGTLLLMLTTMLYSCGDDDLSKFQVRMATVRTTGSSSSFYLEADNGKTFFPAAPAMYWYKAIDGQRVVVNYTLLGDNYGSYDYAVKINTITNVLTKRVENLDAENEEEFGNTPVYLADLWMGGKYLNIEFLMDMPLHQKHRVSLVRNTLIEDPEDGYAHLEYRYNDQNDTSGYTRRGIVSFNLNEYFAESDKGIKVKFNLAEEGEKVFTYNFSEDTDNSKEIEDSDELIDPEFKVM